MPAVSVSYIKPKPYDPNTLKNIAERTATPTPITKYNPYDYPTSLPLFNNPLHKGKGSSSAGNSGDDNHQNNDNNPPVLGYYYGDDDELYFYSNSPYFEPVNNGNDDDYLLGLFVPNDENNYTPAYPISFPVVPNYPNYGNNQADEHYWWSYFVPGYGDYLSFKEAETGWDYTLATAGIVWKPARGAKLINRGSKAKKAAGKADNAAGAGQNLSKTKIETGQQNKHIVGTNEYKTAGGNRSILTADANSLTSKFGTGQQVGNTQVGLPGSKERIDFGKNIGYYINPKTLEKTPTTVGIVHYSKNGAHIVPARPNLN